MGGADVIEIVPEGAAGGDILDEAAAAVDVEDAFPHGVPPGEDKGAVDGADPVGEAGGGGVLGEDGHRHVRVQGCLLYTSVVELVQGDGGDALGLVEVELDLLLGGEGVDHVGDAAHEIQMCIRDSP